MSKTGIPSPARSHGAAVTPRRYKPRGPRSVGSPARSDVSGTLTSVLNMHKDFALSPMPSRRSVLADTTDIEEPKRRSWWRQLGENSREVMEVIESNKVTETEDVEELIEMDVLSQEKKNYTLDLPESSGSESIHSIVMPQRKLFKQKEKEPQKKFGELVGSRESLQKLHKPNGPDKSINVGTRELFQSNKQRSKPIFPAALLDISLNKTVADKTKENINEPPRNQVRNIFGKRAPTKRRNMFAEFVVSESEEEIPEIQPKVFGFPKKSDPKRRGSTTSRGMREPSPASSITTDMEMDDWRQLPSSTMVAEQLEEAVSGTPVKRPRLSKLSEAKESDMGTNSSATDATKQSNRSASSKNKTKNSSAIKDKSLETNRSMTTRNAAKNMQNNIIADNNLLDTSATENASNSKSKISNTSITRRTSKKTEQSLNITNNKNQSIDKSNQNVSKSKFNIGGNKTQQDKNLPDLVEHDKNNEQVDDNHDNEEINFTLEYESDEQQETVAPNIDSKNKTVTRRESNNLKAVVSPENQDQNTTVRMLQSESKTEANKTGNAAISKEKEMVSDKTKVNDSKNISVRLGAGKDDSRMSLNNVSRKKVDQINQMELDQQIEINEEIIRPQLERLDEQMEVDEIDEGIKVRELSNKTVNNANKTKENNNQSVNGNHKEPEQEQETYASQQNHTNKRISQTNVVPENAISQKGNELTLNKQVNNSVNDSHEKVGIEDCEQAEIVEKLEKSRKSPNESRSSKQKLNDSHSKQNLENRNDPKMHIKSKEDIHSDNVAQDLNDSQVVRQDKCDDHTNNQNESGVLEKDDGEVFQHNESETTEQNVSAIEHDRENDSEVQNDCEMKQQSEDEANEQVDNEIEENHESAAEQNETEENNESKDNKQNESAVAQNETVEKNQSDVEEQNEDEGEEENESEVEEENVSEVEEEDESEIEKQDESKIEEQNESEVEMNESEVEEQDESKVEEQDDSDGEQNEEEENESEIEEQNESEVEEQNESEVEEENESEEEQNESEVEQQNESEIDEQNESDLDNHHDSEDVSHNMSQEGIEDNEDDINNENQEESADVIERTETPDSSGVKSPEAVLHDNIKRGDSFTTQGRNTSVRKSKSMIIRPLDIRPSLAPHRDSTGFSDGTKNSSAEGSGWDSHRTTRKTLRQTFGRDFTPRKSLRALVMEKSAKRQTALMDGRAEITSLPQANSTEFPDMSNRYDVEETVESDHELSRRTRQATLEMCFEQIKKKNMERWEREGEKVRNMFATSNKENVRFKEIRPMFESTRVKKQTKTKKDKQVGSLMPMEYLPPEILEDMKYKPPKRFQPRNVSWITKRLYKFLETKLEPKYDYKARVRAEKLVETIYNFAKGLKRHQVAPTDAVEVLKHEMARLDIVKTHFDFYQFFKDYMPREVRIKVIPDIVNKISMPKHGIFSEILR